MRHLTSRVQYEAARFLDAAGLLSAPTSGKDGVPDCVRVRIGGLGAISPSDSSNSLESRGDEELSPIRDSHCRGILAPVGAARCGTAGGGGCGGCRSRSARGRRHRGRGTGTMSGAPQRPISQELQTPWAPRSRARDRSARARGLECGAARRSSGRGNRECRGSPRAARWLQGSHASAAAIAAEGVHGGGSRWRSLPTRSASPR